MRSPRLTFRRRAALVSGLVVALVGIAIPASAGNGGQTPPPSVGQAQGAVNQAQSQAHAADTALSEQQQALAAAQAHLADIMNQVAQVQAVVQADQALVSQLQTEIRADKNALVVFVRGTYQSGPDPGLAFVLSGSSIDDITNRLAEADRVNNEGTTLLNDLAVKQKAADAALADAQKQAAQLSVLQEQAQTASAVLSIQEANAALAAQTAHATLAQSIATLQTAQAQAQAAAEAAAAAKAQAAAAAAAASASSSASSGASNVTFHPVPGPTFTVDTDLTQPSGMTAAEINSFLSGTALAGLGESYINAEKTYHVSARYLVAHSILESAWGTSAIAQDKHNLFGFGADDANPYADAMTFASFDACIQYVAQFVFKNYLSPSGRFFHGPTLRGMNVDYASDPLWAFKIAKIADTIP